MARVLFVVAVCLLAGSCSDSRTNPGGGQAPAKMGQTQNGQTEAAKYAEQCRRALHLKTQEPLRSQLQAAFQTKLEVEAIRLEGAWRERLRKEAEQQAQAIAKTMQSLGFDSPEVREQFRRDAEQTRDLLLGNAGKNARAAKDAYMALRNADYAKREEYILNRIMETMKREEEAAAANNDQALRKLGDVYKGIEAEADRQLEKDRPESLRKQEQAIAKAQKDMQDVAAIYAGAAKRAGGR